MKLHFQRMGWVWGCGALLVLAGVLPAPGAVNVDQEFEFASGLIEIGFADYAQKAIDQLLLTHPELKDRAKLVQAEILIYKRKYDEAEKMVAELGSGSPQAQAISLLLAKGYFKMGDTPKAKALYDAFFKQYEGRVPTDPDLLRFYQESAYQYGQMLEMTGDLEGAINAYEKVAQTTSDKNAQRRLLTDISQNLVKLAEKESDGGKKKGFLDRAAKICTDIQWGGIDLWFGQSIITMANVELANGNRAKAQQVLKSNMDIIKPIDDMLKDEGMPLSMSPMAGARFLLGRLRLEDAEKAMGEKNGEEALKAYSDALIEFFNVFIKYGDSDWGPEAGVKAQEIKTILETKFDKEVKINIPKTVIATAGAATFKTADNLFIQKKYPECITEYIRVLNQFPESDLSDNALASLALAYAYTDDKLMATVVAEYLGERFPKSPDAPKGLLSLGKIYLDKNDKTTSAQMYERYLKYFPQHDSCGMILFHLADQRKKDGDNEGAAAFYTRLINDYPKDKLYPKALSQLAWGAYANKDYENAIKGFGIFIAESQPSPQKAQAQLSLADSYLQTKRYAEATKAFNTLVQWLSPEKNGFAISTEDAKKNEAILEKGSFYVAYALSRLDQPAASVPEYRKAAVGKFNEFLAKFPNSSLAPKAMSLKGAIQMALNDPTATETYAQLAEKYPNSDEGKNANYSLVSGAIEIGQPQRAQEAFVKMIAEAGRFTPDEFVRVGQALLDAGLNKEAAQAFEQVATKSEDRNLLERALFGMGSAQYQQGNYEAAAKALDDLMTRYPKSGLFYDAKFMLGTSYTKLGQLPKAKAALTDVFKNAKGALLINKATIDYAELQKQEGDKAGAFASYQRVVLLTDAAKPEIRPFIEKALLESMALGMEIGRYQDVIDSCDTFTQTFVGHPKIEEVRNYKREANAKLLTASTLPAATPAPAAP